MRDVIYVKLDIVYSINHQLNETISRKSFFFETVKSKVIISLFETVRLSVSISPRNLYNSLESIKEIRYFFIADNITFICFRYALNSLLGIKLSQIPHSALKTKSEIYTRSQIVKHSRKTHSKPNAQLIRS